MIDLDVPSPWEPADTRPPRQNHAAAAAGLAALLVLLLTGPLHMGGSPTLAWQAETIRGFFWVDSSAVYTLSRAANGLRLVARQPVTGRERWGRLLDGPLPQTYRVEPALLLPRFPPFPGSPAGTTVLDARSGQLIGTYPVPAVPIVYFAGDVAVTVDRLPGAPVRLEGNTWYDGWKEPHIATGIDLATGATRWTRRLPAGSSWALPGVYPWMEGFVGRPAGRGWLAVVTSDGIAETWELRTGATTAHADVGPLDYYWSYSLALPDVLVVNRQAWPEMELRGYDPTTLAELWRVRLPSVPDGSAWPVQCADLVCLTSPHAIWAIDRTRNRLAWHHRVGIVYAGPFPKLAAVTVEGPVLLEISTGRMQPIREGWRIVEAQPGHRSLVLSRTDPGDRVRVGLLDQAGGGITDLGLLGSATTADQCHATQVRLVCADAGTVRVWRIPAQQNEAAPGPG